jgi:hypothetical protein
MKCSLRRCALVFSFLAVLGLGFAQLRRDGPPPFSPDARGDIRLPNGKSQRDEILKAEHEANLKDAAKLADLAQELKEDLEKQDRFVLSLPTLKKTEDIEKLVKKIRSRLRHE